MSQSHLCRTALPDGSVGSVPRNMLPNNHPAGVFEAQPSTEDLGLLWKKLHKIRTSEATLAALKCMKAGKKNTFNFNKFKGKLA